MSYIQNFRHSIVSSPPRNLRPNNSLMLTEPSSCCIKQFKKETGLEVKDTDMTGWLKLTSSVGDHTDDNGRSFVYMRSGS